MLGDPYLSLQCSSDQILDCTPDRNWRHGAAVQDMGDRTPLMNDSRYAQSAFLVADLRAPLVVQLIAGIGRHASGPTRQVFSLEE